MKKILHSFGFHLIELLIVLSIIGIFMTSSMPIYSHYIVGEKRLEAAGWLSKLAIAMEQYYIEHNTYQSATLEQLHFPEFIANNHYQLIIQSASHENYLLLAKPIHLQAEKDTLCKTLTLNSLGEKNITGNGNVDECW